LTHGTVAAGYTGEQRKLSGRQAALRLAAKNESAGMNEDEKTTLGKEPTNARESKTEP
jgi:hypothetical protein